MAHQFTEAQVRDTVRALDRAGVEVIEVTHGDGLGGSSFNYGFSRTDEMTADRRRPRGGAAGEDRGAAGARASARSSDLKRARDAGADMVRVATHCTEADVSPQHFAAARDLGMETVGFLMMAHRTSPEDLAKQARIMVDAGCQCAVRHRLGGRAAHGTTPGPVRGAASPRSATRPGSATTATRTCRFGVANSVIAHEVGRPLHRRLAVRAGRRLGQLADRGARRGVRPARRRHRRST